MLQITPAVSSVLEWTQRVAELHRPLTKFESERKQIEDKLNSIKVDITSVKTGSDRASSVLPLANWMVASKD